MEKYRLLNTFLSLIQTLVLLMIGGSLLWLSQSLQLQHFVTEWIQHNPHPLRLFGQYLLILGLTSGLILYLMKRRSYYQVKFGTSLTMSLHRKMIRQVIQKTLDDEMETKACPFEVVVIRKTLEIEMDLSKVSLEDHQPLLSRLEPKLLDQIAQATGQTYKILLTVSCNKV